MFSARWCPMVEASVAPDGATAQKLPKPWVGSTTTASGSRASSCREWNWRRASGTVSSSPKRSVRPAEPKSMEPPVQTETGWPCSSARNEMWCGV
jgi:hypothetical protein